MNSPPRGLGKAWTTWSLCVQMIGILPWPPWDTAKQPSDWLTAAAGGSPSISLSELGVLRGPRMEDRLCSRIFLPSTSKTEQQV